MKDLTIRPTATVREAMKKLNQTGAKCLVCSDEHNHLLGTLSDGDVRKAILKSTNFSDPIASIYNKKPTVLQEGRYDFEDAKKLFIQNRFDVLPVVNRKGVVVEVLLLNSILKNKDEREHKELVVPVVIMAGGKGTRMEPFTKVLPKPLVPVHEKPIIEHIIKSFTDVGCNEFHMTINYKGRILKAYFQELKPKNYRIHFVEEREPLGTAGSLGVLIDKFKEPFFVTNCDIIIKTDFANLYEFHINGGFDVSLVASAKEYIIPYGTCELNEDGHLAQINEKPRFDFLINTGLYVLNPDVLKFIPENKFYDIDNLIEEAMNQGKKVGVFPIDDDAWIDVGQWVEYQKAVEML